MIEVDLFQVDDYPTDSCSISSTAPLLSTLIHPQGCNFALVTRYSEEQCVKMEQFPCSGIVKLAFYGHHFEWPLWYTVTF